MSDLLFRPFIFGWSKLARSVKIELGVEVFSLPDCEMTRRNFAISLRKDFVELSLPSTFSNGLYRWIFKIILRIIFCFAD